MGMYVEFSEKTKRTSMAIDEAGNIDKSQSGAVDESVALDCVIQLNTSRSNEILECQASESSAVCAEKPVATGSDISAERKQKTKSAKSRPTCLLCNKSFYTRYKLNEHHAVVHLDKRLFSCNVCQKTFGRADHLIRHVRNRVCIPRQHQYMLDFVDASSKPGSCIVVHNLTTYFSCSSQPAESNCGILS